VSPADLFAGWEATGNKNALVNAFADFCPAVREFAERAGDDLKVWQLYDMAALPRWAQGRAVLIGDSAHPFQPCMLAMQFEARLS
jgi:salicylate hydroxylase